MKAVKTSDTFRKFIIDNIMFYQNITDETCDMQILPVDISIGELFF